MFLFSESCLELLDPEGEGNTVLRNVDKYFKVPLTSMQAEASTFCIVKHWPIDNTSQLNVSVLPSFHAPCRPYNEALSFPHFRSANVRICIET